MAVDFEAPDVKAEKCTISIKLPSFSFGFKLPPIKFPPEIPFPFFGFTLSCDASKPIDISAGFGNGGGRVAKFDTDPDKDGNANT
jgi:hypothetical protein